MNRLEVLKLFEDLNEELEKEIENDDTMLLSIFFENYHKD